MSKVIRTIRDDHGASLELVAYDAGWLPWRYCIRRIVEDGRDYQRPGQRTCTGWLNFETLEAAEAHFK